jgi:hypothetical protein
VSDKRGRDANGRFLKTGQAKRVHPPGPPRKPSVEWVAWKEMRQRCFNPRSRSYPGYGGRGITVCARWLGDEGFDNFIADMGRKPTPKHSIDRVDVNGNYEPSNCRWATPAEQQRNTRATKLSLDLIEKAKSMQSSEGLSAYQIAKRLGVRHSTLRHALLGNTWANKEAA